MPHKICKISASVILNSNPVIGVLIAVRKIVAGKNEFNEKLNNGQRFIAAPLSIIITVPRGDLGGLIINKVANEATK